MYSGAAARWLKKSIERFFCRILPIIMSPKTTEDYTWVVSMVRDILLSLCGENDTPSLKLAVVEVLSDLRQSSKGQEKFCREKISL